MSPSDDHERLLSNLPFAWKADDQCIHVEFAHDLKVISNAIFGGGIRKARRFLNFHVNKNYNSHDPVADIRHWIRQRNICEEQTVAMMTAVQLRNRVTMSIDAGGYPIEAWVTAGTGNAVDITGGKIPMFGRREYTAGTINTMVFLDANLTDGALINAVMSATEAKTKALVDLGVKDAETGAVATGTSTDCIAIGCTENGSALPYAGSGTAIGRGIGQLVYAATREAFIRANS